MTQPAEAQFCPATQGAQAGIALNGGFCTNGATGALSTAALSSQSLSEVTTSTTSQSSSSAQKGIEERRSQEAQRCPDGFERVGGSCRRIAAAATATPSTTTTAPSTIARPARVARRTAPTVTTPRVTAEPVYKAPMTYTDPVRYAVWAQGFGDYERRTGRGTLVDDGPGPGPGPGLANTTLPVDLGRTTTTLGFNVGLDATFRNIHAAGDVLIVGVLGGYTSSRVSYASTSLKAEIDGPSAGVFATYFSGPFSTDILFKADFLRLGESFSDVLNFNLGTNAGTVLFSGSASTNLINYTVAGNVNYKFPISSPSNSWIEPTAGFRFTYSDFDDGSAAVIGLQDGYVLRLQGGARIGTDIYWDGVKVTPTVTGLAYSDVVVEGGVINAGAFPGTTVIPTDEGKVRGQGIFAVNFDYGRGLSSFVLGEVRGGTDLFGAGGRAGVRYQW